MGRPVLTGLLLTAQVVSWCGSPLFLCVRADGSLAIDLGPSSCACPSSTDEAALHSVIDPTGCHADHRHACPSHCHERCRHDRAVNEPCDCTHIPITAPWMAARGMAARVSVHEGRQHAVDPLMAASVHGPFVLATPMISCRLQGLTLRLNLVPIPHSRVILRC